MHLAHIIKTSQEMQDDAPGPLWSTFFNQAVYTLMDLLYPRIKFIIKLLLALLFYYEVDVLFGIKLMEVNLPVASIN